MKIDLIPIILAIRRDIKSELKVLRQHISEEDKDAK